MINSSFCCKYWNSSSPNTMNSAAVPISYYYKKLQSQVQDLDNRSLGNMEPIFVDH
jgi:hypothetical protein